LGGVVGSAFDNGSQFQSLDGGEQRRVKDPPA